MQFAEPPLPDAHNSAERGIDFEQRGRALALLVIERAEHVFRGERVQLVVAYDVRHCSISNRLRRSDALSRLAGMSSLPRELFARERAVIGEQQHALAIGLEPADAGEQALELVGELAPRQCAGAFIVGDFRIRVAGDDVRPARQIDGAGARDRHHPAHRRRQRGIELAGRLPDVEIGFFHHVGGEVVPPQDAQHDAVDLGRGRLVEALERAGVAIGDGCQHQ